jgi:hypothetical protein
LTEGFNFEWFNERGPAKIDRPRLGIQKRGIFSLNQAGYEALGEPSHVKLAFDRARRVIGIKATKPDEPGALGLRRQPNSSSYLLSGRAFVNRYGIPLGQSSRRYWGEMHGDVLAVDLNQLADTAAWAPKNRVELGRTSSPEDERG